MKQIFQALLSILLIRIPVILAVIVLLLVSAPVVYIAITGTAKISTDIKVVRVVLPPKVVVESIPEKPRFIPKPFSMATLKTRGCVADGFLSEYGGNTGSMVKLINRSECQYLHRALETWLNPPDFEKAEEIMLQIEKPRVVFGMFIAEAIDKKEDYYDDNGKKFDFSKMCRSGSQNFWGEYTCKPSFEKKEYREYLRYITRRAMDIGIQSFIFGQIYFQDETDLEKSELPEIVKEMRDYAKMLNIQIVIGAQTGYITDDEYLSNFDYIEGGVGMDNQGKIEDGPCLSWRSGCWALLWHERFKNVAKNVFIHLDWSGIPSDDMSRFVRMDKELRARTLNIFYQYFVARDIGFLMPMLAPIYKENGGCYGPKKRFYSPDNKYKCKDEEAISKIFNGEFN
jgi:hypothetical protein